MKELNKEVQRIQELLSNKNITNALARRDNLSVIANEYLDPNFVSSRMLLSTIVSSNLVFSTILEKNNLSYEEFIRVISNMTESENEILGQLRPDYEFLIPIGGRKFPVSNTFIINSKTVRDSLVVWSTMISVVLSMLSTSTIMINNFHLTEIERKKIEIQLKELELKERELELQEYDYRLRLAEDK